MSVEATICFLFYDIYSRDLQSVESMAFSKHISHCSHDNLKKKEMLVKSNEK